MSNDKNKSSTASAVDKLGMEAKMDETRLLEHPSYLEMQKKLEEAEEKATQSWDRALRMQAEIDNIKRRGEKDIANAHKFGLEKFVSDLLPVVDNLERALDHSSEDLEGVTLTLKSFLATLEKFGVEQINPLSQPFNPEFHQAVAAQPDATVKPNTVINVMQKGYLLNGRLIRPAMVAVSKSDA